MLAKKMKRYEYALYKGDDFIDVGTAQELARKLKVTVDYIKWMTTPTAQKRNKGKRMTAIKIDIEEKRTNKWKMNNL